MKYYRIGKIEAKEALNKYVVTQVKTHYWDVKARNADEAIDKARMTRSSPSSVSFDQYSAEEANTEE